MTGPLVVVAMMIGSSVITVPLASSVAAAGTLNASPGAAIAGEVVTFNGVVPLPRGRKVLLQRKQGSTWVKMATGKSAKKGAFSFSSTVRPKTTKYRVLAPAIKGKTPASTTKTRTVTTLAQTATLALADSAARDAVVTATGTFTPARPGRSVQLQLQSGATWVTEATATQGSGGSVTLPVDTTAVGSRTYRVVTVALKGAAATTSAPHTIAVTTPAVVPDTTPPPPGTTPPVPDTTPPGPVTSVQVTGTTSSSVSLSWVNPGDGDLTGVMIRRVVGSTPPASPSAGTLVVDKAAPGTSQTDAGLSAGTQYSYALFAHDGVPNNAVAATVTVMTPLPDTTSPGPVTSVQVTSATTSSVSLSWVNPGDGDFAGVMIRRALGSTPPASPSAGTLVVDKTAPGTSHTDAGLSAGTQYSYALFAHDGVPNHAVAASVTVTTSVPDTTPPGPVTAVSATSTQSTASLTWTNPAASDLAGVMIRRALGPTAPASATSGTLVADVVSPGAAQVDSGLAPSTQYSYALFAHDAVPNYAVSATVTVTTGVATVSDWAQTSHDAGHTGWAPDEQAITPANATSVAEEFAIPGRGSPAIAGGLLYVIGEDGFGLSTLTAYNLTTADQAWQVATVGSCVGPVTVTSSLVIVNCNGKPRAYDRTGSHAVVWDVADTDPGQSVQYDLVIGTSLIAWTSDRVASYRLSDGQRVWQQLLPSGASSIQDVAASGSSVVVAYDDRLRALSLTNGSQLWVRADVAAGSMVIAGAWVYVHMGGVARQIALSTGADGWTSTVPSVYRVVAADADTVYVWEAFFNYGPPSPSILHALRASDGSQRWQADVPSRIGSVAVAGDIVWMTSTDIYSQGRGSNLIALKRADGTELTRFSYADNMYGWTDVAFGAGKVVVDQAGSFGGPDERRLRVLGLSGQVPVVTDKVLPLAYAGTAYQHPLTAQGPGPFQWSLVSGTLPTGLSLSPSGVISGSPSSVGTRRVRVQATAANGRSGQRSLTLQSVQTGTPGWSMLGRDATRNPFEVSVPSIDVESAPALGFRWKTVAPGTSVTSYNNPITAGTRLYDVGVDGVLRAWDTTGITTNRAAVWAASPVTGSDPASTFVSSPVLANDRLIAFDSSARLLAVRASDGVQLWRTPDPASTSYNTPPLVVGTTIMFITQAGGVRAYSTTDGSPLWGGVETTAGGAFESTTLSSDGTLAFTTTRCELYAIKVSDGAVAWHTAVSLDPAAPCQYYIDYSPAPIVVEGIVYASTPWGLLSADAGTGAVVKRIAVTGARGSDLVVGGVWFFKSYETLYAVDATSGEVLWKSREVTSLGGLVASRDLIIAQTFYGQMIGLDRVTGAKVWEAAGSGGASGTGPAIGQDRIFATTNDGVYAYGPLLP